MAVVLFMRVPKLSLERYDLMMAELGLDANPPAGEILHIASEAVGSVNVCEVWQTAEAAESFVERRLRDAVASHGVQEQLSYRVEPLHNLFAPDLEMISRIGASSVAVQARRSLAS